MTALTNVPSFRYPHRFARVCHGAALAMAAADVIAGLANVTSLDAREWVALTAALTVGVHRSLRHETAHANDVFVQRGGQVNRPYFIPQGWARATAGADVLAAACNALVALVVLAPSEFPAPGYAVSVLAALALAVGGFVAHLRATDHA